MCKLSDIGQCSFCIKLFPELSFPVTHSVVILCSYFAKVMFLHKVYNVPFFIMPILELSFPVTH